MTTTVLLGTTKGAFLLDPSDGSVRGPYCEGWTINHVIGDPDTGMLWAAGGNDWTGAGVWRSEDGGDHWTLSIFATGQAEAWVTENAEIAAELGLTPTGPGPFTGAVDALWSLGRGNGMLYAGAKPAQLFESRDGGASWQRVEALTDHPSAGEWFPGAAGLTLHTILAAPEDPRRIWVGISAAGVFASEDGGQSWDRRNRRAARRDTVDPHPAAGDAGQIGLCVHNMVRAPADEGGVLYMQNHHGVYRSRDAGQSWEDLTEGLPSSFGFPVAVHPDEPETVFVIPLNGDSRGRYPPDAAAAVWRSRDGGASWQACRTGLPQRGCFFTVLRQAMATAPGDPAGVFFGTNTGSVFASHDAGDSWDEIARHLPTVLSVETLVRA